MPASRIARTRTQDLQPLGTAGQFAADSWALLTALLTRELSADHATLLAEPVLDPTRGETDWYTSLPGEAIPLLDLPLEAQEPVKALLAERVGAIQALGTRFLTARTDSERFSGEMLLLCIQVPDQGRVMVVGGEPVLVGWGHSGVGGAAIPAIVTGRRFAASAGRMVILAPPRPPAQPPTKVALFLSGALAGALLAVAFAAFLLLRDPFGWSAVAVAQCTVPPDQAGLAAALEDAVARESALQIERARLVAEAGRRRLQCTPVVATAPAPPPPVPTPPPNHDEERAERQGAKTGKLQIILAWDDRNDLDLHVVCPAGNVIDFAHRQACGGTLDVDANGDVNHLTDSAVENIYFTAPNAGRYRIVVDPYGMRVRTSSPFRLTIRQEGKPDRSVAGVAMNGVHNQIVTDVEVASQ